MLYVDGAVVMRRRALEGFDGHRFEAFDFTPTEWT